MHDAATTTADNGETTTDFESLGSRSTRDSRNGMYADLVKREGYTSLPKMGDIRYASCTLASGEVIRGGGNAIQLALTMHAAGKSAEQIMEAWKAL